MSIFGNCSKFSISAFFTFLVFPGPENTIFGSKLHQLEHIVQWFSDWGNAKTGSSI